MFLLPVSPMEISKPPETVEETRKTVSPLAPVPYHPPKSLPCPIPPKPQVSTAKPSPQRFLPTPVPVPQKSPSCTSASSVSNTPQPQSTTVTSPPFSPRTAPEKPVPRAAGLPSQTPSSPRGLPPQALPQDEPPWMALAKKKAKAWSEMPQIVQWGPATSVWVYSTLKCGSTDQNPLHIKSCCLLLLSYWLDSNRGSSLGTGTEPLRQS